MTMSEDFEQTWTQALTDDERKEVLKRFIYQVKVEHSSERIHATYWLYKLPIPLKMLTPRPNGFETIHPWGQLRG